MKKTDETADHKSNAQPIEVFGWASDNYADSGPPAVVVNPEANALTLLSWGLGQLEQCNAMLDALSSMRNRVSSEEEVASDLFVWHFSVQAETVLKAGIAKLRADRRAAPQRFSRED